MFDSVQFIREAVLPSLPIPSDEPFERFSRVIWEFESTRLGNGVDYFGKHSQLTQEHTSGQKDFCPEAKSHLTLVANSFASGQIKSKSYYLKFCFQMQRYNISRWNASFS